jgi:hypothetical protein
MGQLNRSTINVTYSSVNGPARCEWHFLSPALPFQEGVVGEERRVTAGVTIRARAFGDLPRGLAVGTRLRFDSNKTVARKTPFPCLYAPSTVTDELELVLTIFP